MIFIFPVTSFRQSPSKDNKEKTQVLKGNLYEAFVEAFCIDKNLDIEQRECSDVSMKCT